MELAKFERIRWRRGIVDGCGPMLVYVGRIVEVVGSCRYCG